MLKETITYTDFNGKERTEDLYFNLTKTELAKMQLSENDGLDKVLTRMIEDNDRAALVNFFDNFILKAYGVRSEDGRYFKKSPELIEEFTQSAAYDALFMKMATDSSKAAAFVNAILPSDATSMIETNS